MEIVYVFVEMGVIYLSSKRLQALYKKIKEYKKSLVERDLKQSDLNLDQMQIQKLKQVQGQILDNDSFIPSDISSTKLIVKQTIKYSYNPISHYLWRPLMQNGIFSNKKVQYQFSKDFILQSPLDQIYVQLDRSKESDKKNVIQLQKTQQEYDFKQILFAPSKFYFSYDLVESGLSVGSKIGLFGNFIYNFQTKQLRCFKVKAIGDNKFIQSVITHKMFKKGVYFIFFFALSTALSLDIIKIIRGIIMPQSKYPKPLNIDKVLIKKGKQDLKCSKCQQAQLNVIALPCTHFDSCTSCLKNKSQCSVCNKHISEQRRVFSI